METEQWNESLEIKSEIVYPQTLNIYSFSTFNDFFGLSSVTDDQKAKKKDKPKAKGKGEESIGLVELETNDEGRKLPFITSLKTENEFLNSTLYSQEFSTLKSAKPLGYFSSNQEKECEVNIDDDSEEIDSVICNVFKFISRFVPIFTSSNPSISNSVTPHQNFLWRSIYPKLPNGKPCFNPSGKYLVRLFIQGKWRRVYVNDSIPLNSSNQICLSHFKDDPYELWPILISKAIYSAYSICGYSTKERHSDLSLFIFGVEALTGWSPQSTHSLENLINVPYPQVTQTCDLLVKLISSGLPQLKEDESIFFEEDLFEFVDEVEKTLTTEASSIVQEIISEYNEEGHRLMTKKEFKEEYSKRKMKKDEILNSINTWNMKVNSIEEKINNRIKPLYFSAIYYQDLASHSSPQIFPILAIFLPRNEELNSTNLFDCQILIDWKKEELKLTKPCIEDKMIKGLSSLNISEYKEAFPMANPATYSWITFKELLDMISSNILLNILSFSTFFSLDYSDSLSYKWNLVSPPTPPPVDPKVKKGAPLEPAVQMEKNLFEKPTYSSLFLLSLDARSFLLNFSEEENSKNQEQDLLTEAIAEQQREFDNLSGIKKICPRDEIKKPNPINISLSLLRDISENDSSISDDEIIIIFHEVRFDDKAPIMFTFNNKRVVRKNILGPYPPYQEDYHLNPNLIPSEYIAKPLLFWIRIISTASPSFSLTLNSNIPLALGSLNDLAKYKKLRNMLNGFYNFYKSTGISGPTQIDTEQLLFRIPLNSQSDEEHINSYCRVYFYTTDDEITKKFTSLTDLSHDPDGVVIEQDKYCTTEGILLHVNSTNNFDSHDSTILHTLMGKVDTVKNIEPYINTDCNLTQLPPFNWNLFIITPNDVSLNLSQDLEHLDLSQDNQNSDILNFNRLESPIKIRYTGKYIPNSSLLIFKDINKFDLESFPIAFNFKIHDLFSTIDETQKENQEIKQIFNEMRVLMTGNKLENINFKLNIYNIDEDNLLIGEFIGSNSLSCYSISFEQLFSSSEALDRFKTRQAELYEEKKQLELSNSNNKKKDKNAIETSESLKIYVNLLFECILLDSQSLPARFYSYLPHVFDDHFTEEPNPMYIPSVNELNEIRDSNRPPSPEKGGKPVKEISSPPLTSHISTLREVYIELQKKNLKEQRDFLVYKELLPNIVSNPIVKLSSTPFPSLPLLRWKIDWLAGPPISVRHDTSLIENTNSIIQQIEESDSGRYERSQLFKNYINHRRIESEKLLLEHKTCEADIVKISSWYTPSTNISLSCEMIESLSQSLQIEQEEVKILFTSHHDIKLQEFPELLLKDYDGEIFDFDKINFDQLLSSYNSSSQNSESISKLFLEQINNITSASSGNNTRSFILNYLNSSSENHISFRGKLQSDIMGKREALRTKTIIQNHALKLLLQRVNDAKNSAKAAELKAAEEQKKLEAKLAKTKKK